MRPQANLTTLLLGAMFLCFIFSCATTRRYESMLEGWIGRDTAALERKWGRPKRVGSYGDGRRLYEYRYDDRHEGHGDQVRDVAGGRTGCTTYFVLSPNGIVEAWKWEGDDCMKK